ncbi:hypothetical protein EB796_004718 [Bugula neritina]|uniref:Uncharacterized protein n=1 Tax=Bugula neritina TaxID=10212 RepID=A0A7J7KGC5_BUGNE|nr:hypothetical protein EB796_004718 [Bugula neritina]
MDKLQIFSTECEEEIISCTTYSTKEKLIDTRVDEGELIVPVEYHVLKMQPNGTLVKIKKKVSGRKFSPED